MTNRKLLLRKKLVFSISALRHHGKRQCSSRK